MGCIWKYNIVHPYNKMLHLCCSTAQLCALQMCPFRKQIIRCSRQLHKRAYRMAAHLRCGDIFWMKAEGERGSDHNKCVKRWTQYIVAKHRHIQIQTHAHMYRCTSTDRLRAGRSAALSCSLLCAKARTGLLLVCVSSRTSYNLWHE